MSENTSGSGADLGSINPFAAAGSFADLTSNLFPLSSEYSGTAGNIAAGMDSAYDGISSAMMGFPPVGTAIGGIMKGAKLVNKALNLVGGGTDGMCVCAGTQVFTSTGKLINIEDLHLEEGVVGWDPISKSIRPLIIAHLITPTIKDCIEIKLKHGQILRCSVDHPILSDISPKAKLKNINGKRLGIRLWEFRRADLLKIGLFVGLANNIDIWGPQNLDLAYLVGLLIGDGNYSKDSSCRLYTADPTTWEYLEENNLGVINHCNKGKSYKTEFRTYRIVNGMKLMKELGLAYQTRSNKTLPENIHIFNKHSVCELLAGLFDSDGSINSNIVLYQTHKKILESIKYLLQKLGIFSIISKRPTSTPIINGKKRSSKESYRLLICDKESIINFYNQIKLRVPHKQTNLDKLYSLVMSKPTKEHRILSGAKQSKIIDIVHIGKLVVYNLLANYDHTYLANGIITHNTTQDAILSNPLFMPFGTINGFFGLKADTFTKDQEVFSQMGSSYGGISSLADAAASKSGKKYGLFSLGAMHEANRLMREAKNLLNLIKDILEDTNELNLRAMSMAQLANLLYANRMSGGYQQGMIRAAKQGALLFSKDSINRAKRFAQKGAKLNLNSWPAYILEDLAFVKFLNTCPEEIKNFEESNEILYDLWRANGKPTDIEDANNAVISMFITDDLGKTKINPEMLYYTTLTEDDDFTISTIDEENEPLQDSEESLDETQMFKEGGQLNVIPEGALHAHKHNLEEINDDLKGNITHKGIPVVSIDENGNVEQLAEVERNELILNKETTDAIEELRSKYNNETSTSEKLKIAEEAGTIFANSLIENTDDRTNLIDSI